MTRLECGDWILLSQCPDCSALWVEVPHEPHGAFSYCVLWPYTLANWRFLYQLDTGTTLHSWHQAEINRLGPALEGEDAREIDRHQRRSGGIEPYNNHNPFNPPDLEALLRNR